MRDFMFLYNFSDKTFILPDPENLRGGKKVRIISGDFAGIESKIADTSGLVSPAMEYLPKEWLERI